MVNEMRNGAWSQKQFSTKWLVLSHYWWLLSLGAVGKSLKTAFPEPLERERKSQYRSKLEEPPHSACPGPRWAFAGSEEGSGMSAPRA